MEPTLAVMSNKIDSLVSKYISDPANSLFQGYKLLLQFSPSRRGLFALESSINEISDGILDNGDFLC